MSEGGSIAARMKAAEERTDELNSQLRNLGTDRGPRSLYRMNDDEFQHHVTNLAHEHLFLNKLGISEAEYKLIIVETWNMELEKLIAAAKEFKAQMLRQQLTQGIIMRPDIET